MGAQLAIHLTDAASLPGPGTDLRRRGVGPSVNPAAPIRPARPALHAGHRPTLLTLCVVLVCSFGDRRAWADPPTGFRGDGTARYEGATPPTAWSLPSPSGWEAKLPDWSNASPVVAGPHVYVLAEPANLLAFRARDGRRVWRDQATYLQALSGSELATAKKDAARVGPLERSLDAALVRQRKLLRASRRRGGTDAERAAARNQLEAVGAEVERVRVELAALDRFRVSERGDTIGYTSATPVSDGKSVWAAFGSGVVAAWTARGKRRWTRWLGEPHTPMRGNVDGHAASPLLAGGRLIVPLRVLHALDPATGETVWQGGTWDDFGSPVRATIGGGDAVLLPSGAVHRARDGALLGRVDAGLYYVGPIVDGGQALWVGSTGSNPGEYASVAMATPLSALNASGGPVTPTWRRPLGDLAIYATPVMSEGRLFIVTKDGQLLVLDAGSGSELGRVRVGGGVFSPSPIVADGRLFLSNEDGQVYADAAGPSWRAIEIGRHDGGKATPALRGDRVWLRTPESLWCVQR